MKKNLMYILVAAAALLAGSCTGNDRHLISDEAGREAMLRDFEDRQLELPEGNLFAMFGPGNAAPMSEEEREALQFLYAYMPLADIADHDGFFFLENVRTSLKAREEMPWGKDIPEREFRHFVLPVRVNNEDLDESRMVFYEELKDRVKNLSLHDAVLEVNHWCHEHVIYKPSDPRTSSPLASVRTAYGRCGEESTLAVAALRAMCIPARQVYTPRWAHTDDNHAWVEAWVDGKWCFLGACEPEPVLNLAWFNAPVSRGLLMHTKVFGRYDGPEDKIQHTKVFTGINITENYAPAARVAVKVTDADGKAVEGAKVEYKIYNYGEYYPVGDFRSDAQGKASMLAGKGDMLVWASKDGHFGFRKVTFGKDDEVTVVLDRKAGDEFREVLDVIPPAERPNVPDVTPEQRAENDRRFAQEDSIRNAYVATFPTAEQAGAFAKSHGFDEKSATELILASRGNHAEIMAFMAGLDTPESREQGLDLLRNISEKDLRDVKASVLKDHFSHAPVCTNAIESRYLRNPRIRTELLTAYRSLLLEEMSSEEAFADESGKDVFRKDPMKLADWVQRNIHIDTLCNMGGAPISPAGVWNCRTADVRSRDIFFVALARTLGIPARINEVTGKVQVFMTDKKNNISEEDYQVVDIDFEKSRKVIAPVGTLKLTYKPTRLVDDPKYYTHFSISKILPGGDLRLLEYAEGGSVTWDKVFRKGTAFDTGDYVLVTGTRLANGGVLSSIASFRVEEGKTTEVALDIRESDTEIQVIGNFNSESRFFSPSEDRTRSVLEVSGRGYFTVGVLGMGQEPTNHALNDIAAKRSEFEKWGRALVLLFPDRKQYDNYMKSEFPAMMPSVTVCGVDEDGSIQQQIATEMKFHSRTSLPMFIIGDTFNRVVFSSQGYTIGLGEQIIGVSRKL